jgi:hypothetical protein
MKAKITIRLKEGFLFFLSLLLLAGCNEPAIDQPAEGAYKIIFLHHSTGDIIWKGQPKGFEKLTNLFSQKATVPKWFMEHNEKTGSNYYITEQAFPKGDPYSWDNYPYDYYNIWVKNAGMTPYMEEPTLEMLSKQYNLIVFKHCFPVGYIEEDTGNPDIDSKEKRLENYKLQYMALKEKMLQFPDNKFLVWTGAANVKDKTTPEYAQRTRDFVSWVKTEWDSVGDNIFLWDFYELETEGGIYLTENNARDKHDSHPAKSFGEKVAPLFCQRIVDVIETNGMKTTLTGELK